MLNASKLQSFFQAGHSFADYTALDSKGASWRKNRENATLTTQQQLLLKEFTREMNVLVMSSLWCGDCIEQCPLFDLIASGSDKINLKFVDRDDFEELKNALVINTGNRVPIVIFMAEDYEFCSAYGDRTLSRYRNVASALNGACSTGIGSQPTELTAMAVQEWLNEFERIQLMLKTSARLRKKHGEI